MNEDTRRRRRVGPEPGKRRSNGAPNKFTPWLITIGAAIAVIVGGWYLGQALAHAFGASAPPKTVLTQPSASPAATPLSSPAPSEAASPTEQPLAAAPTPSPAITQAPATPAPKTPPPATPAPASPAPETPAPATAEPASPVPATPAPRASVRVAAAPVITPAQPEAGGAAQETVRAYIDALKRGDPSAAAAYLGNGSPDEGFIDAQTRITSLTSSANGDGSYKVQVTMQTAQGAYSETFDVASGAGGNRILDKAATAVPH